MPKISKPEDFLGDLSDFQAAYVRNHFCSRLFAVVSWGCAATSWLARVLNSHSDIYCVHAANHTWHALSDGERLEGLPYLRVIGRLGYSYAAAGDVHGISRQDALQLRHILGKHFNAAVVVREPFARLRSQLALFAQFERHQFWNVDYVEGLMARSGITIPADNYRSRLFVHGANMLNAILEEREVGRLYRSEDLTQDTETLGDFVEEITQGDVTPSAVWLRSAIEVPRMNSHADHDFRSQFEDWQVDVIRRVVDPRSWEIYETLGYQSWERELKIA